MSKKKMTVAIQLGLIFIGGKLNLVWKGLGVKHRIPDPAPDLSGNLGVKILTLILLRQLLNKPEIRRCL